MPLQTRTNDPGIASNNKRRHYNNNKTKENYFSTFSSIEVTIKQQMLQQLDGKRSKLLAGTSDLSNLQEKRIIENL